MSGGGRSSRARGRGRDGAAVADVCVHLLSVERGESPVRTGPDALERVIGRAVVDSAFLARLLADPGRALALEPMPLALKRALVAIRARGLGEFAVRALDALRPPRAAPRPARRPWTGRPPA
jgi:hypothetical protein